MRAQGPSIRYTTEVDGVVKHHLVQLLCYLYTAASPGFIPDAGTAK